MSENRSNVEVEASATHDSSGSHLQIIADGMEGREGQSRDFGEIDTPPTQSQSRKLRLPLTTLLPSFISPSHRHSQYPKVTRDHLV